MARLHTFSDFGPFLAYTKSHEAVLIFVSKRFSRVLHQAAIFNLD